MTTDENRELKLLRDIERLVLQRTALSAALKRIESGECVTDWADQPHEQMQATARDALAELRKSQGSGAAPPS